MKDTEALKTWTTCASAGQKGETFFREDNDRPLERMLRRYPGCEVEEVAKDVGGYAAVVKVIPPEPKQGRQHKPFLLFVS